MADDKKYTLAEAREYLNSKQIQGAGNHRNISIETINEATDQQVLNILLGIVNVIDDTAIEAQRFMEEMGTIQKRYRIQDSTRRET